MRKQTIFLLLFALLLLLLRMPAPLAVAQMETVREFTIGTSMQGRPITAVQFGDGPRKLVVVGDTHGGPEANTYRLAEQLITHFRAHPEEVPPEVRLYIIPTLNPDGLALESRFNAAGVDLNRNMNTNLDACPENDWGITVNGAYGIVSNTGGDFPDSEVESRLIRDFLLDASGAIFLHSNAGLVFPSYCEHQPSIKMAQVYAQASGYTYQRYWEKYMITGGMHDWAASIGIAAIIPELISGVDSEFSPNLAGLRAVLEQPEELLPLPQDRQVGDIVVPAVIWRYWITHGGERIFGKPMAPPRTTPDGVTQTFTNARLELHAAKADTLSLVQPAPLGEHINALQTSWSNAAGSATSAATTNGSQLASVSSTPSSPAANGLTVEENPYTLFGAFLNFWNRHSGSSVFGYPVSEEHTARAADGRLRTMQYFERGAFAYYPEDGSVRPEPLGWQMMLIEQVDAPWLTHQIQ
jgi:predicted deacylase